MERLIEILRGFDKQREKMRKGPNWNESAVAECFKPCAQDILLGGYFLVNKRFIIDLGCIELYYHEEDKNDERGKIKDPIMYHTNDHSQYSRYYKGIGKYPYFKFGSFNLHQTGVDVTFENPEKEYRASFLIRSYRIIDKCCYEKIEDIVEELNNPEFPKYNPHSTQIFDDMFPLGIVFGENDEVKIEWVYYRKRGERDNDIEVCNRVNVPEYKKDEKGEYVKEKKQYEKIKGTKEERKWGFKRIGIKEYK